MSPETLTPQTYIRIFILLLILLGLTLVTAFLNLPSPYGVLLNLSIAVFKASLILIYFMHLRFSDKLTRVFALAGFYWLVILIALTLNDYVSRGWE